MAEIPGQTLIFSEKKLTTDIIASKLQEHGIRAESIHGNKSQNSRNNVLQQFNSKQIRCLVATNVASRGLDLPDVEHVINFELPSNVDDYVHRIGRTGRAGKSGISTTYVSGHENPSTVRDLVEVLKQSNVTVPDWLARY